MSLNSGVSILVAEDDANVRDLVRTRLQIAGYDTQAVRNGCEAVARTLRMKPTVLVLDINMPGLDGFGVLKELKAQGSKTKVLMLTARHAAQDVTRAMTLGAKDYLAKPFNDAQLLARVARLLKVRPAPDRILHL